jgi:hypothetical protein
MLSPSILIAQALAPAVAINASGLLALGIHNRISTLGSRVRELNREYSQASSPQSKENLKQQIAYFLLRGRLMRNALFLLYFAIVFMVLTACAIAGYSIAPQVVHACWPLLFFLGGLFFILIAMLLEVTEIAILLRALKLDIQQCQF